MTTYFTITNLGKRYRVAVRSVYQSTVTSERRLLQVLYKSAEAQRSRSARLANALKAKIDEGRIFEVCNWFGILSYSAPVDR